MTREELVQKMRYAYFDSERDFGNFNAINNSLQVVLNNIGHIVETYEVDQVGTFITLKDEFMKG